MAAQLALMAKPKSNALHGIMWLPHGLVLIDSSSVLTDGRLREAQLRPLNVVGLPSSVVLTKPEKAVSFPELSTYLLTTG